MPVFSTDCLIRGVRAELYCLNEVSPIRDGRGCTCSLHLYRYFPKITVFVGISRWNEDGQIRTCDSPFAETEVHSSRLPFPTTHLHIKVQVFHPHTYPQYLYICSCNHPQTFRTFRICQSFNLSPKISSGISFNSSKSSLYDFNSLISCIS